MGCGNTWEDGGGRNIFVRRRNQRETELDGNAVVHRINTVGGVGCVSWMKSKRKGVTKAFPGEDGLAWPGRSEI